MKQGLFIIFLLQCFLYTRAQNNDEEPDYDMGRSIKSDKNKTINKVNLISNLPQKTRGIAGLKLNNDKKYGRYGIDISHHQGDIRWSRFLIDTLPNKVAFIIIKATQGASRVDPKFSKNFNDAKSKGYLVGAYHFYSQKIDPELQANNFIQTVSLEKGDLMPVLDIERNCLNDCATTPDLLIPKRQLIQNLKTFIAKLKEHYQTNVIIYTGQAFYNDYLAQDFKDDFFWIAKYAKTPPKCLPLGKIDTLSNPCFGISKQGCWQYSQSGKMAGIKSAVDLNFLSTYYLPKWIIN
jgi:lysozyme